MIIAGALVPHAADFMIRETFALLREEILLDHERGKR
jgi:hypothetical protein